MPSLGEIAQKVRSKNAGPFWLTIDIFCGTPEAFSRIASGLDTGRVAALFGANAQEMKRFDMPDLNVVKFSLPRPTVQGSVEDRDMHGASWATLVAELEL